MNNYSTYHTNYWAAHSDTIWDLKINSKGNHLVSCSADGTNKIWSLNSDLNAILSNTWSYKVENQLKYDVPTCVSWIDDTIVNSLHSFIN